MREYGKNHKKGPSDIKIGHSLLPILQETTTFTNRKSEGQKTKMGRKKFSQKEYDVIRKLLGSKMRANRAQQKMVRHTLRTVFEFNISDFNIQGQAFGPADLDECLRRGRIHVLDDATIEAMKLRHAEKKLHDEAVQQAEAIADGEAVDWQKVLEEWNEYYKNNPQEAER